MLTKEISKQKRKGVNNQNNPPFHFGLFPVINTLLHHHIFLIYFIYHCKIILGHKLKCKLILVF